MRIHLLVVPDCPHHKPAAELLRRVLEDIGSSTTIATRVINDQAEAERIGFIGSPTVLINGRDPFPEPGRPAGLACRMYQTSDGPVASPAVTSCTGP
ncbi:DF family (seleno)protein [Streptomyces sp. NBC_01264]|uniref:DF family (seleno)protein n=1 Tax=Streptomyces sp. NBC_01264 TaxID=2903804 RepID=UPI00225BC698|nr:hypothetical protein [Streptomyces sp. NBC_01264]MCX4781597.1 DUF2703 domain-containing protein [Streptomyces sp. NBC_01264]